MSTKRKHKVWTKLTYNPMMQQIGLPKGTEQWIKGQLRVLYSPVEQHHDGPWCHASVSLENRYPTWAEIKDVRQHFFDPDNDVFQVLPPEDEYVNLHQNCFHLWSPIGRRMTPG